MYIRATATSQHAYYGPDRRLKMSVTREEAKILTSASPLRETRSRKGPIRHAPSREYRGSTSDGLRGHAPHTSVTILSLVTNPLPGICDIESAKLHRYSRMVQEEATVSGRLIALRSQDETRTRGIAEARITMESSLLHHFLIASSLLLRSYWSGESPLFD